MTSLLNKAKEVLSHEKPPKEVNPHDTKIGNSLNPRIESDLGLANSHYTVATQHGSHPSNTGDTRIDANRDGSAQLEDRHSTASGRGVTHAKDGGAASYVPQKIQEALPERVERAVPNAIHDTGDRHHSPTTHGHSTNAGPHSSNLMNKTDPRVDSDMDGSGNGGHLGNGHHTTLAGAALDSHVSRSHDGPAPKTAGPHKHDILNKLDPRVESKQARRSSTSTDHDTLDAAKVPPSVMREHLDVEVAHGGNPYDHHRRHSRNLSEDLAKYGPGHE